MMTTQELVAQVRAIAEREWPGQASDADLNEMIAGVQFLARGNPRSLTPEEEEALVLSVVKQMLEGPSGSPA